MSTRRLPPSGLLADEGEALPVGKKPRPNPLPASRYTSWRALTLILVYVLMAVHVLHWKAAGRTLAPLELHEVMFTAELGIVTAGFLLMLAVTLATLVFGRFFCSWGCHIMGVQELASWVLGKVGIRPRPIRSRMLLWVPPLVLVYMFGWPQIVRMWEGRDFPALRTQTDLEGISSFVTTDFWRNLPSPWITALTFFVCGFVIVYMLGARSFCTYGCPYGALFLTVDRFARGRIRVNDKCVQCGTCTAVCTSGVRVHEEVAMHGTIVNPRCLKDLDCVSCCPEGALSYGWGPAPLGKSWSGPAILGAAAVFLAALATAVLVPGAQTWWSGRFDLLPFGIAVVLLGLVAYARTGMPKRAYHFAIWEEILMGVLFLATLVTYRQLYDTIPFLLTIGLGCTVAYAVVLLLRLAARPHVRALGVVLKTDGRLRPGGVGYVAVLLAFLAFSVHSAMVQWHTQRGYAALDRGRAVAAEDAVAAEAARREALRHLAWSDRYGLHRSERLLGSLASLFLAQGDLSRAAEYLKGVVARRPDNAEARTELGRTLLLLGRLPEAEQELQTALRVRATGPLAAKRLAAVHAQASYALAAVRAASGDLAGARAHLKESLRRAPDFAGAHYDLGGILLEEGRVDEAIVHLREAVRLDPDRADPHHNLAVALLAQGRRDEAMAELERALALDPSDAQTRHLLARTREAGAP